MTPQGSKAAYSPKQRRMARHIEESEETRGRSAKTAARIGWATVNKKTGGAKNAKRSGSRSRRSSTRPSLRRGRSHR